MVMTDASFSLSFFLSFFQLLEHHAVLLEDMSELPYTSYDATPWGIRVAILFFGRLLKCGSHEVQTREKWETTVAEGDSNIIM